MQNYSYMFFPILLFFLLSAILFIRNPLMSSGYLLWFRCSFSIIAFLSAPIAGSIPFFVPAFAITWLCVIIAIFTQNRELPRPIFILSFIAFTSLMVIASVFAAVSSIENGEKLLPILVKHISPICIYIGFYAGIDSYYKLERFKNIIFGVLLLPVFIGIWQGLSGKSYDYGQDRFLEGFRPVGTIIDPNAYGIFLCLGLFIVLPFALEKNRIFTKIGVILILAAIVLSKNRGTWIAVFSAISLAGFIFIRRFNLGRVALSVILVIGIASPIIIDRFANLQEVDKFGQSQDTFSERVAQTSYLFEQAQNKFLIGHGAGAGEQPWGASDLARPPHNDYVRVFYEFGIIVLISYTLFLLHQLVLFIGLQNAQLWRFGFAGTAAMVYIIIISSAQNLLFDTVTFSMIFAMLAMFHRVIANQGFQEDRVPN